MPALERADGLVNVTLASVEAIEDTLMEMRALSVRLQDESLSEDHRAKLTHEYGALIPRIDQITEMATFGSRNLLNPQAASQSGDVILPGGMKLGATDLRPGITGAISNIDILVPPAVENLRAAFDFEGSLNPVAWTNGFGGAFLQPLDGSADFPFDGPNKDQVANAEGQVFYANNSYSIPHYLNRTMSVNIMVDSIDSEIDVTNFVYSKYNWTSGSARYIGLMTQKNTGNILITVGAQEFVFSTGGTLKPGQWANITFTQSGEGETRGDLKLYLDGALIASINTPLPSEIEDGVIRLHNGRFSDLALWDKVLDGQELAQATNAMKRGVHNWRPEITTADWAAMMSTLDQSLRNVRQVAQQYGGASRSISGQLSMQQRMTDIIDAGVARLVDRDIERVGAL